MIRRLVYFSLLALVSALALQSRSQTTNHAIEWSVRNAQYADPQIVETASGLTITVNNPTPLDRVLIVLGNKYNWRINYEDPHYATVDLVDNTEPNWLAEHPNGRRAHAVGGGAFTADISIPGFTPNAVPHAEQVLPALIKAYNATANPGRFELRTSSNGAFDVVGTAAGDGPQKQILDTIVSFDTTPSRSLWDPLVAFCLELARRSGQPVEFWGYGGIGPEQPMENRTELHLRDVPACEVLRQILAHIDSRVGWRLLYQADLGRFILELHNPNTPL